MELTQKLTGGNLQSISVLQKNNHFTLAKMINVSIYNPTLKILLLNRTEITTFSHTFSHCYGFKHSSSTVLSQFGSAYFKLDAIPDHYIVGEEVNDRLNITLSLSLEFGDSYKAHNSSSVVNSDHKRDFQRLCSPFALLQGKIKTV